jgi:hypothetical protein
VGTSLERTVAAACEPPFPVYPDLAKALVEAHRQAPLERSSTVAHVLSVCAGYAYADTATFSTMALRLGLEHHACVRIAQTVEPMLIFSTAYLVQSRCGRVAILCYRGTEARMLGNWLGDADVGSEASLLPLGDGRTLRVHAGFHRNVRATSWNVLHELEAAVAGRSIGDHHSRVEHPLEALYVTGHSLGGAMALLFALALFNQRAHRPIAERLRAVYTFGQPMALAASSAAVAEEVERKVFRHVLPRDPVPALPPAGWGPFVHIGREYHYDSAAWRPAVTPVAAMADIKEIPRSVLAFLAPEKQRAGFPYSIEAHLPQYYVAALRPADRVSEFGD